MLFGKPEAFPTSGGIAVTTLFAICLRSLLVQPEHCPSAIALHPFNLRINHAGPRANVGDASTGLSLRSTSVKATAVVFNVQIEHTGLVHRDTHLNVLCICVAADIAQGLL